MIAHFKAFIEKENLFKPADKVLLAVSGGIDSMVMCNLFHQAGYTFGIAHCNFRLRGKESDGDEKFVKEFAITHKIPFYTKRFNTSEYADKKSISIEMAARDLRYEWFNELINKKKYDYIATAHHLDDQAETFFINIIRGTGIAGLHGILPKQNKLIRPLLFTNRKDIEKFAKKNNLSYHEDSTNKDLDYTRNLIRHKVIPVLKRINPCLEQTIKGNVKRLRETEVVFRKVIDTKRTKIVEEKNDAVYIHRHELKKLKPFKVFLYELLSPYNFNSSVIDNILKSLDNTSGKQFYSHTHRLVKEREQLVITKNVPDKDTQVMRYVFMKKKQPCVPEFLNLKASLLPCDAFIPKIKTIASFDYNKLKTPLTLRKWEQGDYFYPFGMNQKKKLSDFFIDNKFSLKEKRNTWLLCSGDKIAWVVGHRIDNRFRVTENTKKIYQVELM